MASARSISISLPRIICRYVSGRSYHASNQKEKSERGQLFHTASFWSRAIQSTKLAVRKLLGLTLSTVAKVKKYVCVSITIIDLHREALCRPPERPRMSEKPRAVVLKLGHASELGGADAGLGALL